MENLTKSVNLGWSIRRAMGLAMVLSTVACGSVEEMSAPSDESASTQVQDLRGENGVTLNGVTLNGVTLNGVTLNGVTLNGLNVSGLSTAQFATWFTQNTAQNDMLMKYLVRCAVPEGQSRSFTDSSTGTSYLWQGSLGLAPNWANGHPINEVEQQVISACLAAHVNKFGIHVPLSVLGRTAQGQPIAYSAEELRAFPRREGCFFGNLFTGEGIFAGADRSTLFDGESSLRACALSTAENVSVNACAPMVHTENCENFCTLDPSGLFYTQCTYNGRSYRPLTTRINSDVIYTCGDGVCQYTESCGMSTACEADCGPCA